MIETLPITVWDDLRGRRDRLVAELCGPTIDEARTTEAVTACYAAIGVAEPSVIWVDGPLSVLLAGATLKGVQLRVQLWDQLADQLGVQLGDQLADRLRVQLRGQLGDQLADRLGDQLGVQLGDQLWVQLRVQLWDQLRGQLADQLGGQLGGQLRDQLWDQLGDQLRDQLRDQLGDQLRVQLGGIVSSGWWLASIERWLLIDTIPGIERISDEQRDLAEAWRDAVKCHWWLPLRGAAIMSRQHTELHRDNRGRLHCATGPAWAWADGTAVWALEGIRVPSWVITDPKPQRFIEEIGNAEQRRVAFAAYGWDRAISELGMRPIDEHPDPTVGTLYRLPASLTDEPMGLLVVRNASPHPDGTWATYGLTCPAECRTAEQAQAALMRLSVDEWRAIEVHT